MTTIYRIVALLAILSALYFVTRSLLSAKKKAAALEALYEASIASLRKEIAAREEARLETEKTLSALRNGAPANRLSASVDVLRDISSKTSRNTLADRMAESKPTASDGN